MKLSRLVIHYKSESDSERHLSSAAASTRQLFNPLQSWLCGLWPRSHLACAFSANRPVPRVGAPFARFCKPSDDHRAKPLRASNDTVGSDNHVSYSTTQTQAYSSISSETHCLYWRFRQSRPSCHFLPPSTRPFSIEPRCHNFP